MSSRKRKFIAFAPALVAIGLTAFVASGAAIIPGATAASTVTINGSVTGSVAIDAVMTGCADTSLDTFEAGFDSTDDCTVQFASNYATGSEVQFEDNINGNAAFFCSDGVTGAGGTRDCSVANNRVENTAANVALADDRLGIALTSITAGTEAATRGAAFIDAADVDATPTAAEAIWYPITDAAQELCFITVPNTDSKCSFRVAADGASNTGAGDYTGQIGLVTSQH